MISQLFNEVLYRPLFNFLVFLYNIIPDFGITIIILTIIIRLLLLPLNKKAFASQEAMKKIQAKIKKMQKKHKDDPMAKGQAMMDLYKKNNVSPFSSFMPMLIQFPLLIALFKVLNNLFKPESMNALYSFVPRPDIINPKFIHLINLSQASIVLAIIAGGLQLLQMYIISGKGSSKFVYFFPILTVFIGIRLPAGLPLYWVVLTLSSILEHKIFKKLNLCPQKTKKLKK